MEIEASMRSALLAAAILLMDVSFQSQRWEKLAKETIAPLSKVPYRDN
jgi:hypothetical protein